MLRIFDNMRKTKKEQKKAGEVRDQTAIFSRFYNFINSIDYKKHWKIIKVIFILGIILAIYSIGTFLYIL